MAGVKDAIRSSNPFAGRTPGIDELMDGMLRDEPVRVVEVVETPALALMEDGTIPARNFTITAIGLYMHDEATAEDWQRVGEAILRIEDGLQLIIGDWLHYGEARFKVPVAQVAAWLKRDPKTLQNWSWVCSSVPHSLRKETLFFGHYNLVAARDYEEQQMLLDMADRNGWTVAQLRENMKKKRPIKKREGQAFRRFEGKWLQFERRLFPILADAKAEERKKIAARLRAVADEIDRD